MAKSNLPTEVHDHFQKATLLHGYVEEHLGKASGYALEAGEELLAAKKTIPHGRWEEECNRLFAPSARTARFYMQFASNMGALPKRQRTAILMIEGTLDGAAKAAKKAAKPKPPKPPADSGGDESPETSSASDDEDAAQATEQPDLGKCPNCAHDKWDEDEDGFSCANCRHPWGEPAGDPDEDRLKTQRQKTVKTIEALMRAFDDLQAMLAKPEHDGATKWTEEERVETLADMGVIPACKGLLKLARAWK